MDRALDLEFSQRFFSFSQNWVLIPKSVKNAQIARADANSKQHQGKYQWNSASYYVHELRIHYIGTEMNSLE